MMDVGFTITFGDNVDQEGFVLFGHANGFDSGAQATERLSGPEDLEYIFQLIRSHFIYIEPQESFMPPLEVDGKQYHSRALMVLSLPFLSETDKSEIGLWNDIVKQVSEEFKERQNHVLRGICSMEDLERLVSDRYEDFEYEDRKRLDPKKLVNLVLFSYDFCMLTMKEACLIEDLDTYVEGTVVIRGREFKAPIRRCASIRHYCLDGGIVYDGSVTGPRPDYDLPSVELDLPVKNPHANDSYVSAMFVDLMHKFFLSFGLKKFGKSDWAAPERWLIYELLRLFGLCKSDKPAKETKYVTTVMREYGDYFSKCNLRTWLREEQAYCRLLCSTPQQLTDSENRINEPFIALEDYYETKELVPTVEAPGEMSSEHKRILFKDLPPELQAQVPQAFLEIAGSSVKISHVSYGRVVYGHVEKKRRTEAEMGAWDPRLDYVMGLIESSFDYITFLPYQYSYIVARQDIHDADILSRLVSHLEADLLAREEEIPRGLFTQAKAMQIISEFRERMSKEDKEKTDVDKLYMLFLFIFDYVYLTYKEPALDAHLRMYIPSTIEVGGKPCRSTMLNDDMLYAYLENPYTVMRGEDGSELYQQLKAPDIYVPEILYPMEDPSCNVKNMTAMFFDLFARFFKSFGLKKRPNATVVSDQENILISELSYCCGICGSDKVGSARAMFRGNQYYFQNSSLEVAIRENEYGYLMLNTMSEELFGPKTKSGDSDS